MFLKQIEFSYRLRKQMALKVIHLREKFFSAKNSFMGCADWAIIDYGFLGADKRMNFCKSSWHQECS